MKSNLIATLGVVTIGILACGKAGVTQEGASTENISKTAHYGYEFTGVDGNSAACTTGKKQFSSIAEMCFNIQDPVQNGKDCARRERMKKFFSECENSGVEYHPALGCRVSIVKKETKLELRKALNAEDILESAFYCVGPSSPRYVSMLSISSDTTLYDDIGLTVDGRFVPDVETSGDHRTRLSFVLSKSNEQGSTVLAKDSFSDFGVSVGTLDKRYKYQIACSSFWACDAVEELRAK